MDLSPVKRKVISSVLYSFIGLKDFFGLNLSFVNSYCPSTIFYSMNPIYSLLSDVSIDGLVAHELTHLGHWALVDSPERFIRTPLYITEGFAELVRRVGLRLPSRVYNKEVRTFRDELATNGIDENNWPEVVKYVKAQST